MSKTKIDPYLRCNGKIVCVEQDWFTPNTYCNNFDFPPNDKGIYLLVAYTDVYRFGNVVYIGSSSNLKNRYAGHEVLKRLKEVYEYMRFYFRLEENYLEVEKKMIFEFNPKFNKIHTNCYA